MIFLTVHFMFVFMFIPLFIFAFWHAVYSLLDAIAGHVFWRCYALSPDLLCRASPDLQAPGLLSEVTHLAAM